MLYCEQKEKSGPVEINGGALHVRTGDCLILPVGSVIREDALLRFGLTVTLHLPAFPIVHEPQFPGVRMNGVVDAWIEKFVGEFPKDATLGIGRISVPEADRQRWRESLERLRHELTVRAPRGVEAAQALLTLFSVDAARYAGALAPTALSPRRVVAEVFRYINEHLAAPICLGEIASAVNFSPAYLTDLMKRETGRPIVSWIIELRLARAEHLLAHTDHPVSWIASIVGYTDANSFGRAFTKRRGLSPWQWRRRQNQS